MRGLTKKAALIGFGFVWGVLAVGFIQANVAAWATSHHYDTFFSRLLEWLGGHVVDLTPLLYNPWYWLVAGLAAGFAAGVWLDVLFKRQDTRELKSVTKDKDSASAFHSLSSNQLYLGRISASFVKILTERYVELALTIFNGSDTTIYIDGIAGRIAYNGVANSGVAPRVLPAPTFMAEIIRIIKPKCDGSIVIEQKIPSDLIESMEISRSSKTIHFSLDDLKLVAYAQDNRNVHCGIKLWNGFTCLHGDFIAVGQIICIGITENL